MAPARVHQPSTHGPAARVNRIQVELGLTVRDARRRRGWSIRVLAERAAVSSGMVQRVEAGGAASLTVHARLAQALNLELQVDMADPRRQTPLRADADLVHALMGEMEAAWLAARHRTFGLDEPWQHFHFAGRADLVAWDAERGALLHIENKTQVRDTQDALGRYNGTRAHLAVALWARLGLPGRPHSETHVLAALWSAEVLRVLRRQPWTFRATCPDPADRFEAWLRGESPGRGSSSSLVLLDPFASGRQRPFVSLDKALTTVRPRVSGYAEAASHWRATH